VSEADRAIRQILADRDRRQAASGEVPLYARPHGYAPGTPGGKCEVCGREDYAGIHMERQP
jgi:hypothetical protein